MSDDFRPFAIYKTENVSIDLDVLIKDSLLSDDVGEETWQASPFSPPRSSEILVAHRERDDVNQGFLLIVDRQNVAEEGLLCVNLDFKGAPDVVREKAHELCYALPSLSIDNTDWHDDILANADLPLYPRKCIAMLVDPSDTARKNAADIVDAVDGGLGGRHSNTGTFLAEWEGVITSDVGDMLLHFENTRVKKGWNEDYFLCVRESAVEAKMVEIVNTRTQRCHACPWETAGEVLIWLFVGLIEDEELDEPGSLTQAFLTRH